MLYAVQKYSVKKRNAVFLSKNIQEGKNSGVYEFTRIILVYYFHKQQIKSLYYRKCFI